MAVSDAGWGAGQLEGDMRQHAGYAAQGRGEILFETSVGARWAATWRAEGIDPSHLVSQTGRA